jgi:hypothetical protein
MLIISTTAMQVVQLVEGEMLSKGLLATIFNDALPKGEKWGWVGKEECSPRAYSHPFPLPISLNIKRNHVSFVMKN